MTDTQTKAIALLFSGGLDTTLEAVERLKEYTVVHLLTFNNGCCINMGGAVRRVKELTARYGDDRFRHVLIDTRPLMQSILQDHKDSWQDYRSPLVFDLVCKLSAATELIFYARTHGVTDISDGAAVEQTQIFLQHPEFTSHIKPYMSGYGLQTQQPVHFNMTRREKIVLLGTLGFNAGSQALEKLHITSQLAHQPFCLRGFVTFFFTSPIRHLGLVRRRALSIKEANTLWDRLLPIAKDCLDGRLAAAGAS
jgi:hypothetical protein